MRRLLLALGLLSLGRPLHAQTPLPPGAAPVTVRGIAFDSLRSRPLAGAFVTLDDGRDATADAEGRFRFDGVTPGAHTFAVQHAALDSVGLSGIASRVVVGDASADVRVATPSFATLWARICGDARVPKDSGLVYGTVTDASTGALLRGASVDLTWTALEAKVREHRLAVSQVPWRGVTRTNARGAYAMCGTPLGVSLRIRALTDSLRSDDVDLVPDGWRIRRRDLALGPVIAAGRLHGTIVGVVTSTTGRPVVDARVQMDGVPDVRTDSAGRFMLADSPIGTRQIEVLALGMSPYVASVDVGTRDTALVSAQLRPVTTLDGVRVTASRAARRLVAELDERQRSGMGFVRDSAFVAGHGTLSGVFAEFPGANVERERGTSADRFVVTMRGVRAGTRCTAAVWIDGFLTDYDQLTSLVPGEIAILEVYPNALAVPMRFTSRNDQCGVVAVWTKWAFR